MKLIKFAWKLVKAIVFILGIVCTGGLVLCFTKYREQLKGVTIGALWAKKHMNDAIKIEDGDFKCEFSWNEICNDFKEDYGINIVVKEES